MNMNQYINKGENIKIGETLGKEGFTHSGTVPIKIVFLYPVSLKTV